LLRAIQEKAVRPIGSEKEIPIDVRLISATHKNLLNEVQSGHFRDDLYYRVNVIDLAVPPLRNRRADVPLIAAHILKKMAGTDHPLKLTQRAHACLMSYDYPGNIRELENILARAAALLDGSVIDAHDLELSVVSETADVPEQPEPAGNRASMEYRALTASPGGPDGDLDGYLAGIERGIIETALDQHRWNRTAAAKSLGITLRSLRYRLKKLGIED